MILRNKKTGELWELIYRCPDELNDEWEEYKPAEPLIKDEKVRKAVRAWAEENLVDKVVFDYIKGTGSELSDGDYGAKIIFYGDLRLTNRETYTIDELCGEEEE